MFRRLMACLATVLMFAGFISAQAGTTHWMGTVTAVKPDTVTTANEVMLSAKDTKAKTE